MQIVVKNSDLIGMSVDELLVLKNELREALEVVRTMYVNKNRQVLQVGDIVSVTTENNGKQYRITKVNRKGVKMVEVSDPFVGYNCPISILKKVG